MDRRNFLKTTGAVAVAGGATAVPAPATEDHIADSHPSAPAISSGGRALVLSSQWPEHPAFGPERLARRIEAAADGRYRFEVRYEAGEAEVTYGSAGRHIAMQPAFAFFVGLPFAQGLGAAEQAAWLSVGGGGLLWDELAAAFAFKPLLAGHTGTCAGVWATARLEVPADVARATLHVEGLAAEVLRALGATALQLAPSEVRSGLADGRLQAAEVLAPHLDAGPAAGPLSQRLYEPAFHRGGLNLSLDVRREIWETLSASDRLLFEACAAQEHQLSLAEGRVHASLLRHVEGPTKWPVRLVWGETVENALTEAMADTLEQLAAGGSEARRIHDSYQAFRHLLGEDLIA
jgi:TRAP-type mannitol/chloroaromatic compound transport system substrate-binding protein